MLVFSLRLTGFRNSNGVLQPFSELGWWRWMYRLSPYTYLVEALMGNGKRFFHVRSFSIIRSTRCVMFRDRWTRSNCSDIEYVTINPPAGMACSQYMDPYIASSGGYLTNPALPLLVNSAHSGPRMSSWTSRSTSSTRTGGETLGSSSRLLCLMYVTFSPLCRFVSHCFVLLL